MKEKVLMKGNEAIAEAAIIAGCRHYFGYPITPQTEIPEYLARRMPQVDGVFLQAESELASINMVYGAAGAGARAMTSSSSPGISLMQETISTLAAAELPCVVVNISRGGPGLGSIQGAQSDYLQSTKGGGHGDYRLLVLAPNSVQEMADLTVIAFDRADHYRTPVLLLGDGVIGQMMEPVILPEPVTEILPKLWASSGTKGRAETNVINSLYLNAEQCEQHNLDLQAKYQEIKRKEVRWEERGTEDAEWLLVAYGISSRIALTVMQKAWEEGLGVGIFRPITLWPFPSEALANVSKKIKGILIIEQNAGQMIEDVRLAVGEELPIDFHGRMGGVLPEPYEILEQLKKFVQQEGGE